MLGKTPPKRELFWLLLAVVAINLFLMWSAAGFAQSPPQGTLPAVPGIEAGTWSVLSRAEAPRDVDVPVAPSTDFSSLPTTPLPSGFKILPLPGVLAVAPANDNYCSGLDPQNVLTPGSACKSGTMGGNGPSAGTVQSGEVFGCNGSPTYPSPTKSVWYSFIATQTSMYISLQSTGTTVCSYNYGILVYQYFAGLGCPSPGNTPPTTVVGCKQYASFGYSLGSELFTNLNLTGLTPGATYLVQIVQHPGCPSNTNTFCISLGVPTTCNTCSNPCGPLCTFNQPTSPTVSTVTSTCPVYANNPPLNNGDWNDKCWTFTATNAVMDLQMIIRGYGCVGGNVYSATYNLYTASCGGSIASGNVIGGSLTNLTVGQNYVICYNWQAACPSDTVWPYLWASSFLPIELSDFGAVVQGSRTKIYWTSASEINNKEYVVERLTGFNEFLPIAKIEGAGNSTRPLSYSTYDAAPAEGFNYYRLRQVDFDGHSSVSKAVMVYYDPESRMLVVQPNPARESVTLYSNALGKPSTVLVRNIEGETLVRTRLPGLPAKEFTLDVRSLPKGLYVVHVQADDESFVSKLVKN